MIEGSVRDHVDALDRNADLGREAARAVLGVHDHGVHRAQRAGGARALAGARLAREDVVGGQDLGRATARERPVELLDRQPLPVDDVGLAREAAAVAQHVRDVAGDPGSSLRLSVEGLHQLVAVGSRTVAVAERARHERHLGARARQRRRQRVVIGRRVGRGVDDVNASRRASIPVVDGYEISDDATRLDVAFVHEWLSERSYWAVGRTRENMERAIANSLNFGLYAPDGAQAGFARVVTDRATFAWLADVFVAEPHRGRGLSVWLVRTIVDHPELASVRQWILGTLDAHTLYEKVGFGAPAPDLLMTLRRDIPEAGVARS